MRFVFDTSVLVSALLLPHSTPRRTIDIAPHKGKVLVSYAALAELYEVLSRKKFLRYVREEDARLFVSALTSVAEWVDVDIRITVCRDPKDNKFLELAVSGRATHIISGDADLLVLNPFQGIQIISPTAFLNV